MGEVGDGPIWRLGEWAEVAAGVYRMVVDPESVNVGLVVGETGALLIDTGSSPAQGEQIRESIAQITDLPLQAVVVTHAHHDHAFGLSAYADLETIGHESLADDLRGGAAAERARQLGVSPADLVVPSSLISVADAVDLGGSRVAEVVHLGDGHTRGDLVVSVIDAATEGFGGVIFAGDLIETAGTPWFGPDSSVDQWSWAVDRLHGLGTDQTLYVPGHGDPIGRDAVAEQRNAIDAVRMEVERLAGSGVDESSALAEGNWPFPAENVAAAIPVGYAEIRARNAGDPGSGTRPTLPLA